ncbi:TRIM3 [Branchiostoma lanceolatum]|uniref:TRIM3 protein n=1 Tax=Branchiostoma lanceolatum TaxID=7740 RepID=A0A8J9YYF3_BRALA|nr:TRIM3 [Branchiostoma lanceolatum]
MSEAHRTLLLRNFPTIYQDLDATRVLGYLHPQGVLTEEMREEILAIPERHHRTRKLLDLILQMDDRAFIVFRTALGHAGYLHLVELLTEGQQQLSIMPLYQKEQVRQLKMKMRVGELKALDMYQEIQVRSLERARAFLSQESLERRFDELQAKFEEKYDAIIVSIYSGCVILFLTFESEPKFEHFWGSCTSGDLSTTLSELLITEEMRGLEGGDQLVVRTLVLEQDVRAWRDFFQKGATEHVRSQMASMDARLMEQESKTELEKLMERPQRERWLLQPVSRMVSRKSSLGSLSFPPSGLMQATKGFSSGFMLEVERQAVESLPCSVTVTTSTVGLTGSDVAPQVEVTSPQGKTILRLVRKIDHSSLPRRPHTSPTLAAGKVQTSSVRGSRVWGAKWRPQTSGKHSLRVCMGDMKLSSHTVDVGTNNPVLRFGQRGSQQGQLNEPTDVAVSGDRLYVADYDNNRVQVFDLRGNFCQSFSTRNPGSLAVQTDGTVLVRFGKEVMKFYPSGELLHKFPLDQYCKVPYGLAVQRDGRVVVTDTYKHCIFMFEADGTLVKQVGGQGQGEGQFNKPCFVCVDKEDNIIVADKLNHRVQVFDKNLNFKHKFGQFGTQPQDMLAPFCASADSKGNIVVVNSGYKSDGGGVEHGRKLQVFRTDGTWVATISSDGDKLNNPHGVAVTEDGHVFVAEDLDHCIRKYRYM